MEDKTAVVRSNIYFLRQGISILNSISDLHYSTNDGLYFKSGIGRHFRHIIEHYTSFIQGYNSRVNYDDRERNLKLETSREFAISKIDSVIKEIDFFELNPDQLESEIHVLSNQNSDNQTSDWSKSSVRRELQFLISHTVHHYALIAFILKTKGVDVPDNFGVAPSTLNHESLRKESF